MKCQPLTPFFHLVHLVRVRVFQIPSFHFLPFRRIRRTLTSAAETQLRELFSGTSFRELFSGPNFRDSKFSGLIFFGTQSFRDSKFSGLKVFRDSKFFGTQIFRDSNFPGTKKFKCSHFAKVKFFGDPNFPILFRLSLKIFFFFESFLQIILKRLT